MIQASQLIAAQQRNTILNQRDWGSILYNVVAFGARGEGDDTIAIQNTIDSAIANNSKSVFFLPGNYTATVLTGLDQVNLFGDNATLTVGGVSYAISQLGVGNESSVDMTKSSSIYAKAIDDGAVPTDSLSSTLMAIRNKSVKIAITGDSITAGADQISYDDSYAAKVVRSITQQLSGVSVQGMNYSVPGYGVANFVDPNFKGGTSFNTWWAVADKSWIDTVKDYNPDLLVIAFGMNDTALSSEDNYNKYMEIKTAVATWNPVPSIVVVPTILPTKDITRYNQSQKATLGIAKSTRQFAIDNGYVVADANRLFRILRDGLDDLSTTSSKISPITSYPVGWTGDTSSFSRDDDTLAPQTGATGKYVSNTREIYNGTIESEMLFGQTGIANAGWINYRVDSTLGRLTLLVVSNTGTNGYVELYSNDSGSGLANAQNLTIVPGTYVKVKIVVTDTTHQIYINDNLVLTHITTKKMHAGAVEVGSAGVVPTFRNMSITYRDPLQVAPYYTEDDLLGKYNSPESGNGINHPSALGHDVVYVPSFAGLLRSLSGLTASTTEEFLPTRYTASQWQAPSSGGMYPTNTTSGAKLYYIVVSKYSKNKGVTIRRLDNGQYYKLSTIVTGNSNLTNLEDGKLAYYSATDTQDFVWISIPGGGDVTFDTDLYRYIGVK